MVCRGRHAVSTWQLLEPLAGGTASLLQWRLQTGRTHQIRVHAKHMGHPLLGDEAYGGAAGTAVNAIGQGKSHRHVLPPCLTARVAGQFWLIVIVRSAGGNKNAMHQKSRKTKEWHEKPCRYHLG